MESAATPRTKTLIGIGKVSVYVDTSLFFALISLQITSLVIRIESVEHSPYLPTSTSDQKIPITRKLSHLSFNLSPSRTTFSPAFLLSPSRITTPSNLPFSLPPITPLPPHTHHVRPLPPTIVPAPPPPPSPLPTNNPPATTPRSPTCHPQQWAQHPTAPHLQLVSPFPSSSLSLHKPPLPLNPLDFNPP